MWSMSVPAIVAHGGRTWLWPERQTRPGSSGGEPGVVPALRMLAAATDAPRVRSSPPLEKSPVHRSAVLAAWPRRELDAGDDPLGEVPRRGRRRFGGDVNAHFEVVVVLVAPEDAVFLDVRSALQGLRCRARQTEWERACRIVSEVRSDAAEVHLG